MIFASREDRSAMAQWKPRILAQIVVTVYVLVTALAAHAEGLPYTVRIDAPRPLERLLENNLDLVRWRGNPRLDLEQLRRLVKLAPDQVRTLVATEGYYAPRVSAVLDTGVAPPVARVSVDPGQPVLVGDVDLQLRGFVPLAKGSAPFDAAALRNRWTLPVGARFRQADWEAAKRGLLRDVMQSRFPRAQLVDSSATVDPDEHRALLKVVIDSGPEIHFGALRIVGLERYPASVITNLNKINPGDEYSEAALQALQARIQDTGYFASVEVSADTSAVLGAHLADLGEQQGDAAAPAATGPTTLPVLVRVRENKRKNAAVGLGFSTNTGGRAQVAYDDLNVFGKRMKSNLTLEQRRQTARADFYRPTTAQGYNDSFGGGFERTDINGEVTSVTSVAVRRSWGSPLLERSLTFEALTEEHVVNGFPATRSKSLPLTYSVTKRALDSLVLPTRGYVVNGQIGGALLPVLTDEQFVRGYAHFVGYRPVGVAGTLVLRGEAGAVGSKNKAGVPNTFLFRAGGDQSVRGYTYQSLGVKEGEATVGARYLLTASAEYQYWFKPPWGAAVFYDAGNAADTLHELRPKVGYGVGARWRSPVGPINLDVAYGKSAHKVRLHFSLGFTF
jgi:translocation and assembly module TamA